MKIGRNDPCPCGSGKKYKKCCLGKEDVSVDLLWRRLGEAHDRLVDRLMTHAQRIFGNESMAEALDEFMLWPEDGEFWDDAENHVQLFYPWFLFNWVYDPNEVETELRGPVDTTVAQSYLEQGKKRVDPLERRLIEETTGQPFSFYEVQHCRPGRGYRLVDLLRGDVFDVLERMGSQNAQVGDMLLARVIQIDSVAMLIGCGSILIPPRLKPEMIRFRNRLLEVEDPITTETLQDYDFEIREFYFTIYDGLMQPPELQNTDGEPFIFHTLYYEIDSPDQAFECLASLSVVQSKTELRSEAEMNEAGQITRVTIPWSRKGFKKNAAFDSTILGRLEIDNRRLKANVNSARRAEMIRREIESRLGNHARYQTTEIQPPEAILEAGKDLNGEGIALGDEHDELMQIPEVRERMRHMLSAHWKGWIDEKIPALGGKTPRQAVKTSDGRESVEALVLDAERQMAKDQHMRDFAPTVIADVRRRLGIDKSAPADTKGTGKKQKTERVEEIQRLIKNFGQAHLTIEYTDLALKLCDKIGRMRKLYIQRGRIEIWAAAIVCVIARLNFLFDPENEVSFTADDMCKFFGTKKTTVSSKAGLIQKTGKIYLGDAEFSIPKIARMFSIYESEDGLLIPGFMLDKDEADSTPPDEAPLAHNVHKTATKNRRNSKVQAKGQGRKANKKSDERQLKLFHDD